MITSRQQAIAVFIGGYVREHGYGPSVREVGRAVGLASTATVQHHILALERAGIVSRDPDKARTLRLVER